MPEYIFKDKSFHPDKKSLNEALGSTAKFWDELKNHLNESYGPITEEWKFYSAKWGWTLKMLQKKRNLFFFKPFVEFFSVTFIFGDKAVSVVEQSNLPKDLIETLVNEKKYAEGRSIRIEVKSSDDLEHVKKLIEIKVNN